MSVRTLFTSARLPRELAQATLPAAVLLLVGCANGFQAPISEQGERLLVTPPLIVDSNTPDSSLRSPQARPSLPRVTANTTASTAGQDSSSSSTTPATYRVRRGDTLYSIAFQFDLDARMLARGNGLNPPYTIFVNQELSLNPDNGAGSARAATLDVGVPVSNNAVARAQGASSPGTHVSRQAITRSGITRTPLGETIGAAPAEGGAASNTPVSSNAAPQWQWPHKGRIERGFDAQSKGIDIDGSLGDPVFAASDGDVVYAGSGIQGAGELIILRHNDRYLSAYAHNSAMLVREGDRVQAGQKIAELGATQAGDGMLHFEIRLDGKSVDPIALLPRP